MNAADSELIEDSADLSDRIEKYLSKYCAVLTEQEFETFRRVKSICEDLEDGLQEGERQ